MSDGNSNDPFAERLKRIEARKQEQREANPNYTDPATVSRNSGSDRRPVLPMAIFGGGVLMLLIGVAVLASVIKGNMVEVADEIEQRIQETTAFASPEGRPSTDVASDPGAPKPVYARPEYRTPATQQPRTADRDGYAFGPGFGVTAMNEAVALNTLITDFRPTTRNVATNEVVPFEMNTECTLRPVGAGEKLVSVNVSRSMQYAPLQMLDNSDVLETLIAQSKEKLEEGKLFNSIKIARGAMRSIDVVVTDTEAPLYLALQTLTSNTLWNITAAPGVEIAHVALISSGDSAVAGLPAETSFEAIASSDFSQHSSFYDFRGEPGDLDCMLSPYTLPKDHWGASTGAAEGNSMDGNFLFSWTKGFEVYSHWYKELLGEDPEFNLITAAEASGVLVGDAPTQPLAFTPLGEKRIHLPAHDQILTGTVADREAVTQDLYNAVLLPAAGSEASAIIPPPSNFPLPDPANPPVETKVEGQAKGLLARLAFPDGTRPKTSLSEINKERRVSFQVDLTLEDLLAEGEAMPPEELQIFYMYLRAPRYMQRFCEDTLPALSTSCAVFRTTVHSVRNRRATQSENDEEVRVHYTIRSDFGYIPNYTIGPIARIRGGGFMSAFLPAPNTEHTYQTAEERQEFLSAMLEVCARVRLEYGNCLVGTAGFYLNNPSRFSRSDIETSAAGWVEIYGLEHPLDERAFQERAAEIYAEIQAE